MKINQRKTRKMKLLLVVAFLLLGTVIYLLVLQKNDSGTTINFGPASEEEKKTGEKIKEESIKDSKDKAGSDPLPAPRPSNEGKPVVGMDVTSVNQDQDTLRIRVIIKTIANSGTCKLQMTHSSGLVYETSAETQALASSTTCKGFDISKNNLRNGSWDTTIFYENDSVQSQTTKVIEVE